MLDRYVKIAYTIVFVVLPLTLLLQLMEWVSIPTFINATLLILAAVLFFWKAMIIKKETAQKNG